MNPIPPIHPPSTTHRADTAAATRPVDASRRERNPPGQPAATDEGPTILIVEDNPAHARLTEAALRANAVSLAIHTATTGTEALLRLRRHGQYKNTPAPSLVLLDLGLPDLHGLRVLWEIKNDPRLRHTPVVMLTASDGEADVAAAYESYANAYVRKPIDFGGFVEALARIQGFWLHINRLPSGANS